MTFLQFKNQINPPSDTTYENCLKSYVSEVQTLKEENSKLKKQLDDIVPTLQKRVDALEKLNQSLSYQNQILESAYANKSNSNSDICEALSKKFQSKDEKIAILKAKNKELKSQNRIINSKLSNSRASEQASIDKVRELENKLNQMEEINEAMQIRIDNYEESLQLKTTSILEEEITKLKKVNSQLSKKLKKFQSNFSQPSIHQHDFSVNQRKTKSPLAEKSHRTKSPLQNQKSSKRKSNPNSYIYKPRQNDSIFNDLNFSSDSVSDYNTKSESDFEINDNFNYPNSYIDNASNNSKSKKTTKSSQKNAHTDLNFTTKVTPESELTRIADLLKQNYSGFSPSLKISDQFRDFIDQISAIASKD